MSLSHEPRLIFESFFSKKLSEKAFTVEELTGWINAVKDALQNLRNNLSFSFEWKTVPTWDKSSSTTSFSFSTEFKYSSTDDFSFPFSGYWNAGSNKFEALTDDNKSNPGAFNLEEKISDLSAVLKPLESSVQGALSKIPGLSSLNIFQHVLPDMQNFVGWKAFKIGKGESVKIHYSAVNSPVSFVPMKAPFFGDKSHPNGGTVGWKALDIVRTVDLSDFSTLFASLWAEKIGEYKKKDGSKFTLTSLVSGTTALQQEWSQSPLSTTLHILYSLLDPQYQKKDGKSEDKNNRTLHLFFNTLFSSPLSFPGSQLAVNLSSIFYGRTVEKFKEEVKGDITEEVAGTTATSNSRSKRTADVKVTADKKTFSWKTVSSTDLPRNIFTSITKNTDTRELKTLFSRIESWFPSFGSFCPFPVIVSNRWKLSGNPKFDSWAEQNVATNESLVRDKQGFLDIFRTVAGRDNIGAIKDRNWPNARLIGENMPWDRLSVHFTRLNIAGALRTVLTKKTNLGLLESIGLSSKKITWLSLLGNFVQRDMYFVGVGWKEGKAGQLVTIFQCKN